jgi:cytochrome c-type biogenesis protein CcmH
VNTQSLFFLLAAAMVAAALALILPGVWRGALRRPSAPGAQRRAWQTTALLAVGLPAVAIGYVALRSDLESLGDEPSVLSGHLRDDGLPADGTVSQQFYAELDRHLQQQPRDYRALVFKARLDMRAERFDEAAATYERAVAGRSKAANDPGVWVEYAEARGMAQGRTLVGEPLRLVQRALGIDARHAQALDLAGSAAWEMRDFTMAAAYWKRLLAEIPASDARHAEVSQAIARAERQARLSLPPTP